MPYMGLLKDVQTKTPQSHLPHGMDADLGLFYQLLQMVDGDWSDSINGICTHIRDRFNALGVFLSVFDKKYNEFIYLTFSLKDEIHEKLKEKKIRLTVETGLDILKRVYSKRKNILEYGIFEGDSLDDLIDTYFKKNRKKSRKFARDINLKTVFAIPDLDANKDYTCFFHILTDREVRDDEKDLINDYLTQLHVALEIIFLVRELYIKATHDSLTKLFNHKQGQILLSKEIDRVHRNKQPLSVVMIDIDYFKRVNDIYGHQAGNKVLEYMGTLLSNSLRRCDVISRYGGEEFLVVFPDTRGDQALEVIKRLKDTLERHDFNCFGKKYSVTASFGLCQFDHSRHFDASSLIQDADRQLYRAKQMGRNRIESE